MSFKLIALAAALAIAYFVVPTTFFAVLTAFSGLFLIGERCDEYCRIAWREFKEVGN